MRLMTILAAALLFGIAGCSQAVPSPLPSDPNGYEEKFSLKNNQVHLELIRDVLGQVVRPVEPQEQDQLNTVCRTATQDERYRAVAVRPNNVPLCAMDPITRDRLPDQSYEQMLRLFERFCQMKGFAKSRFDEAQQEIVYRHETV